jgi:hypothetical protein
MPSQETLCLDFGEPPMPAPEACGYELKRWRGKTLCAFRGHEIWTNCREVGHCVWDGWHQCNDKPETIMADDQEEEG